MRRKKLWFYFRRIIAWTVVLTAEALVAATPAALVGAALIPLAYEERGYQAIGGEWLAVITVFCLVFIATHTWLCNKLSEEG